MSGEPVTYYKGMLENGNTRYNRPGWYLPKGNRPGKWMPKVKPRMCKSGYHVATIDQLPMWITPAIYVVEVRGRSVVEEDKSSWEQARLVRRVEGWGMTEMVTWAKRCAEHVAHLKVDANAAHYAADAAYYAKGANGVNAAYYAVNAAYYAAYDAYAADAAAYAADAYAYAARNQERAWQVSILKEMLGI